MMISGAFNYHVEPVRIEMTGTQHIPISHVCYLEKIESKGIIADKILPKVYSTVERESERVIVNGSYVEGRKNTLFTKVSEKQGKGCY